MGGVRLPDGRWAIGSLLGGLIVFDAYGTIDQIIDSTSGLPDDLVYAARLDREGSLWLALNSGVVRLEIASPLTVIDARLGLRGNVYAVVRHENTLWVATTTGFYKMDPAPDGQSLMHRVDALPRSGWSLLSVDDELFAGSMWGLYIVRGERAVLLDGSESMTVFAMTRSRINPDRVWIGSDEGLSSALRVGGRWMFEGPIEGGPGDIRSIHETDAGVLWCGTGLDGYVRVEIPQDGPAAAQLRHFPSDDAVTFFSAAGRLLATKRDEILRLDEESGGLIAESELRIPPTGRLSLVVEDASGNLWMNSRPPVVALRDEAGWNASRPLMLMARATIDSIFTEADGVVWLAAETGLYRHGGAIEHTAAALPPPRFARIVVNDDRMIHGGAAGVDPSFVELEPASRRLRIELAPLSYRSGIRYQTRLEPLDQEWRSAAEPFAELGKLPPGSYTFHARTVGPDGAVSPEIEWSFSVLSPWYQAPWAMFLWAILALASIAAYGNRRSRVARQRARTLELVVAQKTSELQKSVEELQTLQDDLKSANARLEELSLQDDLTGIANRRHLQSRLSEEWQRAARQETSIAFILADLDHFKQLNDSKGHREGDECLQLIARMFATEVVRTGDVVARYGGEEFAVLLPNTDLAGGVHVAEHLRSTLEEMAIQRGAAEGGPVTASFGVAAVVPSSEASPDWLVDSADRALYRAKSEGRNRVIAFPPGASGRLGTGS